MANYDNVVTDRAELADIFYPVGTYYETIKTASEFDPNIIWPGTVWELETAGKVHISAGTGYTINSTGGSTTTSYTFSGTINGTTLNQVAYAPAHTHGSAGAQVRLWARQYARNDSASNNLVSMMWGVTNTSSTVDSTSAARFNPSNSTQKSAATNIITFNNSHSHTSQGSGTSHTHPDSSGAVSGTATNLNVEQAYIAVNRWHRTG